jgi:hypothetical protein
MVITLAATLASLELSQQAVKHPDYLVQGAGMTFGNVSRPILETTWLKRWRKITWREPRLRRAQVMAL